MIDLILIIIINTICNTLCFFIGFNFKKDNQVKSIKITKNFKPINPMDLFKSKKEREEQKAEEEKLNAIMQNINNYDGTSRNQIDIP